MIGKIIDTTAYSVGLITLTMLALFVVINIVEKIQIKIKQGKDPKTNIWHINRLIRRIERQGWRVEAYDRFIYDERKNKPRKTYKAVSEVRLSKTRINELGIEVDENGFLIEDGGN